MTLAQQTITIGLCAFATMLTRFIPFLIFPPGKPVSAFVRYLGNALPCAVFAMLVVYCLRNVNFFSGSHGIPEAAAIAVTILLHLWRKQMLLSIAGGTLCYMLLVQWIF